MKATGDKNLQVRMPLNLFKRLRHWGVDHNKNIQESVTYFVTVGLDTDRYILKESQP